MVPRCDLVLVPAALIFIFAVACSTSAEFEVAPAASEYLVVATEPTPTVTPAPTPTPSPRPTATPTPTPIPTPTPTVFQIDVDLVVKLPEGWSPLVDAEEPLAPTELQPEGGQVPTVNGGNRWKYTGVMGKLKPKERVVPAAVDPPAAVVGAAVLTGVPGDSPDRPALIVKIDNVPPARPQTGLNEADILYEELVEGGVTRFAAVFHSQAPTTIGPVRSGRSTDIGIIDSFNEPIFAFSGANSIYERLIDKQPIVNRGHEVFSGYWRSSSRYAPNNLYTSAETMLGSVTGGEPPAAHFAYRSEGQELPADAVEAGSVRLNYLAGKGVDIDFRWSEAAGGWQRWQAGTPHVDTNGVQLAPANLIVQFVNYIDTGMTDKFGEDLYEGVSVGTGTALVFTEGHVIEATWTRSRLRDVATFTDPQGHHIALTPGQTFVALIAPGGATWS